MKWKKIGNILILDNKFTVQSDKQLKEILPLVESLEDSLSILELKFIDYIYTSKSKYGVLKSKSEYLLIERDDCISEYNYVSTEYNKEKHKNFRFKKVIKLLIIGNLVELIIIMALI